MNQHPGEFLPLPPADLDIFCTPAGHRLLVPRSVAGLQYILDEIELQPGRLLPCLLLAADCDDDAIFDEIEDDGLRWRRRLARVKKKPPMTASPPASAAPPPRRSRRTRVS